MFDFKATAEVKNLNVRMEIHGDERQPAIDVQLMVVNVPVERITSACPKMAERFYDGDQVAIGEVNPLTVGHKLENLTVELGGASIVGATIKKGAKIQLLPGKVANVLLTVQAQQHGSLALDIIGLLKTEVACSFAERQLRLAGMEQ